MRKYKIWYRVNIRVDLPNNFMKTIQIICDEDLPLVHLLNDRDFEVIGTSKECVFAMTRKDVDRKADKEVKEEK